MTPTHKIISLAKLNSLSDDPEALAELVAESPVMSFPTEEQLDDMAELWYNTYPRATDNYGTRPGIAKLAFKLGIKEAYKHIPQ